ncbi:MAG: toll/interleukin-1 receptor domain-containing protein [Bacteroidales bacterium]|nr:toll/interleukin-1 receptor domain-containing protein [Bacteroidales bacterium]
MAQQDIFISYSRKDTPIADRICGAFDKAGITYFIDRQGIGGGMEFPKVLAEAILSCKIFLYLGSENSYKSRFTNSEVTYAFNKKPKEQILPYIIDGSSLPTELEFVFSCINIRNIKEHPIETTLVQDVLEMIGKQAEFQHTQRNRNKTWLFTGITAGVISIGLAVGIYSMMTKDNRKEEAQGTVTEQVTVEEPVVVEEPVATPKDPDFIFNTEEDVRAFLSGRAFESPQGLWFSFDKDLTMEFWTKGSTEGRPIGKFIIKDIKGDSAVLDITYDMTGQGNRFINILECIDGKVSININGGGYKYYALN